jgi:CheY-like chemotaxis protein
VKSTKVLVVEDNGIVALDLKSRLQALGYAVPATVSSGEEAIQKAAETRPDLVLMDIRLKGDKDGIQAAEEIRARFDIPIVYITALADEDTLQRARRTEPLGYVIKPFNDVELRIAIETAISRRKTKQKTEGDLSPFSEASGR